MAISENINIYRVYVIKQRRGGSETITHLSTKTPFFSAAKAAFLELYKLSFDKNHLVLMSKNNKQINAYRYQSEKGDRDYFNETMGINDGTN
ncbi:hypothetical protein [Gilliamella sp. ESL0250]|uniref:hypothetical protein n=1 Tax=Gilliamella sp. ESL0250 TaxID=2705036 RepID=UPI0015805489|nr:hypothetical protein [Gilliamella sp. ESL0250]NUF49540.1 hypothetical protein [Gilliamella sp. ESL0250]